MTARFHLFLLFWLMILTSVYGSPPPDDFPRFEVPGREKEMESLRRLFWLHYEPAGPLIPLWDEWMPMSTLWPARNEATLDSMRTRWANALSNRRMNAEGYVHTQQHDGPAHAEGWPFPTWMQMRMLSRSSTSSWKTRAGYVTLRFRNLANQLSQSPRNERLTRSGTNARSVGRSLFPMSGQCQH